MELSISIKIPISSSINDKWRLWHYNCSDFPQHWEKHNPEKDCKFCVEVQNLIDQFNGIPIFESTGRWPEYLKEDMLYGSVDSMVSSTIQNIAIGGKFSFVALARQIYFNRKVGFAFFRDTIPFDYDSPENCEGGAFHMFFFANARDTELLTKFDNIFCFVLQLLSGLSWDVAECVNGIFLHSELFAFGNYEDKQNLPLVFRLEIWIRNLRHKEIVKSGLIDGVNSELMLQLKWHEYRFFKFRTNMDRNNSTAGGSTNSEEESWQK